MTIFADEEEGGGDDAPPIPRHLKDAAEAYQGGPWVVRGRQKRDKRWFYQVPDPAKKGDTLLTTGALMTEMIAYDDPYVADSVMKTRNHSMKG